MKQEIYTCDICKKTQGIDQIHSLSFMMRKLVPIPQTYNRTVQYNQDRHICHACIERVAPEALKEYERLQSANPETLGDQLVELINECVVDCMEANS